MRSKRNRSVDHEQLVAAAVAHALAQGLHAVTLEAVANRCDAPLKAVQQVEPDLALLVAAAFSRIVVAELAEVKRIVLAHPSPVRQLRALLETLAEPVRAEVDSIWLESWSLGRRYGALGAAVREQEGAWHLLVVAVVRRGIRSGDFLPVDADLVAAELLAMIDSVNAYALVGYRSDLDRMRLLTAVARAELGVRFDEPGVQPQAEAAEQAVARAVARTDAERELPSPAEVEARAPAVAWAGAELTAPGEAAAAVAEPVLPTEFDAQAVAQPLVPLAPAVAAAVVAAAVASALTSGVVLGDAEPMAQPDPEPEPV